MFFLHKWCCGQRSFYFQWIEKDFDVLLILKTQIHKPFSSVTQSCPTLCNHMNCSMPGLPDHHQLRESTQILVHWVSDAIQPSHPLLSPSPPALNLSQHQGLFKWVSSSHQMAEVLEFQLQHQSFQWTPRTDLLYDGLVGSPAVQGTLKSLLQHHSSKASILQHSAFFLVQLSHPYATTGKTMALTRRWPSNPTPKSWGNQNWKRHMYPIVHCSTIYNS